MEGEPAGGSIRDNIFEFIKVVVAGVLSLHDCLLSVVLPESRT
jgi:hypothetical protein